MCSYIVLGGAGDVGSRAVEDLASHHDTKMVTIADRNETVAKQIRDRVLQRGTTCIVRIAVVDAFNHEALTNAIKGHDVCLSALGPFHLFEVRCARASIAAGVNYCSVCDDWNAAQDIIDELHQLAVTEGVVCVTGFGATPGVSNMAAMWMASHMDVATDVDIQCFQPLNAGGGEAVLRHMLFVMSGNLPIWRDGRVVTIKACSQTYTTEFPKFGRINVWNMGHAEPATMHRYMPTVRNVQFKMGFGPGSRLLVWPAYLGVFKWAFAVTFTVYLFAVITWVMAKVAKKGSGALRIDVTGMRDGKVVRETMCGLGEMREVTGMSLAVGAEMLAKKEGIFVKSGVYAPEGAVDFKAFATRMLATRALQSYHDIAMTRPVTEEDLV